MSIFQEITDERTKHERQLANRHPKANLFYKLIVFGLVIALGVAFIVWGNNVRKDREEDERKKDERAAAIAEQQKKEEEEQRLQKDMFDRWAKAGARQLYGIRNFIEKYNYSERDKETYLRCSWNRYLYYNKLTDLAVLIYKTDQFVDCSENGRFLTEDEEFARKLFSEWYVEAGLPCDPSYIFAELTPQGVFLVDKYGADGYQKRWRAS